MPIARFRLSPQPAIERAVAGAIGAGHYVSGPETAQFERALAATFGCTHAIATINGFAALHLALLALGAERRALFLPAASTCFAVLNAALASGAAIRFVDLDREGRVDVEAVARAIETARVHAPLVLAPAHFGIRPAVGALEDLGCLVLEDAAQAFHSRRAAVAGAAVTVLSFYPSKHLNAIDGGAVLTDSDELAHAVRDRCHYAHQHVADGVQRFNYRMPALHAAAGLASLEHVAATAQELAHVARRYADMLGEFRGVRMLGDAAVAPAAVLTRCVLAFPEPALATRFSARMLELGVECGRELLALVPAAQLADAYPCAAALVDATASLPLYPGLSASEIDALLSAVVTSLRELGL